MNPNDRPRFSSVLARAGAEIAKLPADAQARIRADFVREVAAANGKRPIDVTAFLGTGATAQEVTKAFREEYASPHEGGVIGRGVLWASQHGAQAFVNFIPALEGATAAN